MKILAIFTILAVLFLATESREYDYHLTLKPNVFDVYWSHNITKVFQAEIRRFYFKFVAKTTGWAALGLSKTPDGAEMIDYDIALGGVRSSNDTYLGDYFSQGYPPSGSVLDRDNLQSLVLTNATEADGYTTIEFNRKAKTSDNANDVPIENNTRMWLMWAIAPTDATGPNTYVKHNEKGYTRVAYNMFTGEQFDAPVSTTSKPNGTGTTTPSIAINIKASLLVMVLLHLGTVLMLH